MAPIKKAPARWGFIPAAWCCKAIPTLLNIIIFPVHVTLGRAVSWSMANMGEAAVEPLFRFARNTQLGVSAHSLAITTLGYIHDPRVPSILRGLWDQYRRQVPDLVIAALVGFVLHGQVEQAHKLAMDTESQWRFQGTLDEYWDHYWENLAFSASIEHLKAALEQVKPVTKLPDWPVMLRSLESASLSDYMDRGAYAEGMNPACAG